MEKSRSLGSCSSPARPKLADGNAVLRLASESPHLKKIHSALGAHAKLHLVGGTVREAFLGKKETDLDLACAYPPEKASAILGAAGIYVVETGLKHGTITAVIDQRHFEITSFRKPLTPITHREDGSISEDLSGRDFTINAMAFSLDSHTLIDPFGGKEDLASQRLRAVGLAKDRFVEDPLRILRMIRFGTASGRCIDEHTLLAAEQLVNSLKTVSPERIREELKRILSCPFPAQAFASLKELKIIDLLLPEMLPSIGFEQNDFHMHDVFDHTVWVIERCPAEGLLRWVGLFHDLGKPQSLSIDEKGRRHFYNHEDFSTDITKDVMRRLRFSNDEIEKVSAIVRYHMRPIECGPAGVRRLLRDLGNHFDEWLVFKAADAPPKIDQAVIDAKFAQFRAMLDAEYKRRDLEGQPKLAIGGNELMGLGMKSGPILGGILKRLEEMVIENPALNERSTLLREARNLIGKLPS